jgi:signal transduction histidine kinase
MAAMHTASFFAWLPADARLPLLRRGLIVAAVALLIAAMQTLLGGHSMGASLVYSCSISASIWTCTDVLRVAAHRWLGTTGPHYWALSVRMGVFLLVGMVAGYALGTAVGDAYAGHSTLALVWQSPQRFVGLLAFSLLVSLGFLTYFYLREHNAELQRQATESQLQLLRAQLDPHMLFNTLANMRVLMAHHPEQATHMLDHLVAYLRATLGASRADSHNAPHTLGDEVDRLQDYLALMAVRMGPRLQVDIQVPDALRNQPVLPLLLQPLAENAIRHGLEPHIDGGTIALHASCNGPHLHLTFSDTGCGGAHEPSAAPAGGPHQGGLGLAHVRERLHTRYGKQARMTLHSPAGQGTRIELVWPLS